MIPTPRLRFVTRTIAIPVEQFVGGGTQTHTIHVLQQWWDYESLSEAAQVGAVGEWRDVPVDGEAPGVPK